ncbi:hypothetical protein CBR_g33947 [Chara braunii]|uniref:Uncharacterized protein n=1 Tax=Chara braunii TaxID=69332 RepID=A0A388LHH5_CHABU|nr:hypothetical protein CBR_g33947 [Chara braunii]|eukprot:GBG81769.1 hypothetical protein CBR_g33947 [Chara braunii]
MGTDTNCPKYPKQPKERKLLPNMLAEVEEAPGIWFVADSNYDGWVFDDNLEEPDWVWHYVDKEPMVKKPNIFPPTDSRWQKKGMGKVPPNPIKFKTDPLIDPQVIREEKDREDLLWDLDAVREQVMQEFDKEASSIRSRLKGLEQASLQSRVKTQAENKRTLNKEEGQKIMEGGLKKRKTINAGGKEEIVTKPVEVWQGDTANVPGKAGSETSADVSGVEEDSSAGESEKESQRSLQWLKEYVEKVKGKGSMLLTSV